MYITDSNVVLARKNAVFFHYTETCKGALSQNVELPHSQDKVYNCVFNSTPMEL
jgi:hypothetical protein